MPVMEFASQLVLLGSLLFLLSILASTLSPRLGVPLLLVFLLIGMLAGEDGPGGIRYDDMRSAFLIGTLALAVILFDGGLRTDSGNFRVGLRPAVSLATLGVVVTAAAGGLFAVWILELSLLEGLLVGAIVGSTDAAAVFSVLTLRGLQLKSRVAATLEIESGMNDPMAIFITIALVNLLVPGDAPSGWTLAGTFLWQMGAGGVLGYGGGRILARALAGLKLSSGLYPLLAMFGGLFIYAAATELRASGFLAVYLAGLVVGNRVSRGLYNVRRFHDGIAWLAQISLFVMLGLLVAPSELWRYAPGALLVGVALMLIARPLAVWICLLPFRFDWREQVFISWVGLRGAVPIVLAMFPWLAALEQWESFFNVAFFIVLVSLVVQGWTVTPLARLLKLDIPSGSARLQRTELDIPGHAEYDLVGYRLDEENPMVGRPIEAVVLPDGCGFFCVLRDGKFYDTAHDLKLRAGDYVYLLVPPADLPAVDSLFADAEAARADERAFFGELVINPRAKLGELSALYGFGIPERRRRWSIQRYIYSRYRRPVVGDVVRFGKVEFVVRKMRRRGIGEVGLKLPRDPD